MKIAVFYNLPFSGAKRSVFEHVKGLSELNNSIDVYTLNHVEDIFDPKKYSKNHFSYSYKRLRINLPILRKIFEDLSDFILLRNLHMNIASDINSRNYDFVLVHTDHYTQAPYLLKYLKTKNAYFCLEPLKIGYEYGFRINENIFVLNKIYEALNRTIRKKIDRDNALSANKIFAISLFGRELAISSFDLYPRISYLGVDTEIFKKLNIKKKNQILFIGQKLKINGYQFALEAVNRIPKEIRPELKIVSIGKNNRLSDKEIVKLYNESLITLSLSNFDTFGLVPLESMACGTPVITFNVAGYREIVKNNETGYLIDFNSDELTSRLVGLIKNKKIREKMGKEGVRWVNNNWTWKKHVKLLFKELKNEGN